MPPSDFSKRSTSLKKKTKSKAGMEFANVLKKHNTKNNFILFDSKEKKLKFLVLTLVEKAVSIDKFFISLNQITATIELKKIITESSPKDSNAISTEETINPMSTNTSLPEINLFLVSVWLDQANAQL